MNRDDWLIVGMRLFGLYLFVNGAIGGITAVLAIVAMGELFTAGDGYVGTEFMEMETNVGAIAVISAGLAMSLGAALLLGAPSLARWLNEKDARALDRRRERPGHPPRDASQEG